MTRNETITSYIVDSSVRALSCVDPSHAWVGTSDGNTLLLDLNLKHCTTTLSGPDIEPITSIDTHKSCVFTSCRDGIIRVYKLDA